MNTNNSSTFVEGRTETTADIAANEPSATTKIDNDGDVPVSMMKMRIGLDSSLLAGASTGFYQEIKQFLAKPYPISVGTFAASDNSTTFGPNIALASFLSQPMYAEKVRGFMALRATLVLRLQVNADRFMQGKYLMCFAPLMNYLYPNSTYRLQMARANRTTVTQLPKVELDLGCDTEAVLEIPYVSPYTHYNILTKTGDLGVWFIYPYVPLATGATGSNTCEFTVWASLKDVELVAPTFSPQSEVCKIKFRPRRSVKSTRNSDVIFEPQMTVKTSKVARGAAPTNMEQMSSGVGPVESVLKKVSKAADVVAEIPILSNFAGPVSWASDIFARAASSFGWSKPIILKPAERMVGTIFPYKNNVDGADTSMPLSLTSTNLVEALPGFAGTNVDETSIDVFKTIPAFVSTFNFSKTAVVGDLLYAQEMIPASFETTFKDGSPTVRTRTPMAFLANMFAQYKGSIRLTFKIAKTEFHSGRLILAYKPGAFNTNPSLQDTSFLHREIIDVRTGNEFSFVIPYVSTTTYRSTTAAGSYGQVYLFVLNTLTAPDSVSSSITFVVEASAAPDMEFSIPIGTDMTPYSPLNIQIGQTFVPQMGSRRSDSNDCSIADSIIGGASLMDDNLTSSRYCVGEKIMSLNQLVKRTSLYSYGDGIGYSGTGAIFPFSIPFSYNSGSLFTPSDPTGYYSAIALCFGMSRGGMRVTVIPPTGVLTGLIRTALQFSNVANVISYFTAPNVTAPYSGYTTYANELTKPLVLQSIDHTGGAEVLVPQYTQCHSRVNCELMTNDGNVGYKCDSPTAPKAFVTYTCPTGGSGNPSRVQAYRCAADDFQMGYFIGVPPTLGASVY